MVEDRGRGFYSDQVLAGTGVFRYQKCCTEGNTSVRLEGPFSLISLVCSQVINALR